MVSNIFRVRKTSLAAILPLFCPPVEFVLLPPAIWSFDREGREEIAIRALQLCIYKRVDKRENKSAQGVTRRQENKDMIREGKYVTYEQDDVQGESLKPRRQVLVYRPVMAAEVRKVGERIIHSVLDWKPVLK